MDRTHRTEFPHFAAAMPPIIDELIRKELLVDESWHNDELPSFSNGRLVLWVDALKATYAVTLRTVDHDFVDTLLTTGSLRTALVNVGIDASEFASLAG